MLVVFSLLKKVYSRKIEDIIQTYITYITKNDFFPAFREAHFAAITESNIRGGFRAACSKSDPNPQVEPNPLGWVGLGQVFCQPIGLG
jgi:hypothetical protein